MSRFGSLFTKAELKIHIDKMTEGKIVARPGERLEIHIEFTPKKDFYIRQATVELIRIDTHIDERTEYNYHSDSDDSLFSPRDRRTVYRPVNDKQVILTVVFLENENVYAADTQTAEVRLTIPPGTLPTVIGDTQHGINPGVFYKVQTTLDIPKSLDVREVHELLIV